MSGHVILFSYYRAFADVRRVRINLCRIRYAGVGCGRIMAYNPESGIDGRTPASEGGMETGYDIEGKTALVTGANRGIGRAIAEAFLRHGAGRVYAAVREPEAARPLVERHGDRVVPLRLDLTLPGTIAEAAESARDVQVVVNNAGVFIAATVLEDGALDALEQGIEVNVRGLVRMAQAFAPILAANGGGAFVQINSVAALKCAPGFATHSASKAAAYAITQALRDAMGRHGTAVLSVHPGLIATGMSAAAGLAGAAAPPALVGEGIVEALRRGDFHLFPDAMARRVGEAYRQFAREVVEADIEEYQPGQLRGGAPS
ncbi:Short-chain dehydrogenase [Nitrosovibrio sp. Nv17]|nr:Short-chain dehydrogenase [Nitrosovibrio sp. Nv17]